MANEKPQPAGPIGQSGAAAREFELAVGHHQAGRLREADQHYRRALAADPGHVDSLHLLGVLAHQVGRSEIAVDLIGKALARNDDVPDFHYNIGLAFGALGRFEDAARHNRRAIALRPDHAQAHLNLGNALNATGRHEDAIASYRAALGLQPGLAEAHYNIANALAELGRHGEAVPHYEGSLALRPGYAEARTNLGAALMAQGKLAEAAEQHRAALRLKPDLATAMVNLGNALRADGKLDEAITSYRQAVARDSRYAEAHNNLGVALAALGSPADAAACFRQALALKPAFAAASVNLVRVLIAAGDLRNALDIAKKLNDATETAETRALLFQCLRDPRALSFAAAYRAEVTRAIAEPWGNPRFLAGIAAALLEQDSAIGPLIARANAGGASDVLASVDLAALAQHALLRTVLESVQIQGVGLERLLTLTRRSLLALPDAAPDDALLPLLCALARQCFINEYVFEFTADEVARVDALRASMTATMQSDAPPSGHALATLACYAPLHTLPDAPSLLSHRWPEPVRALLTQQIAEPGEEVRIRAAMPRLTRIDDGVSQAVRAQYEQNPYPRWTKTAATAKPQPVETFLRERFPFAPLLPLGRRAADYLVAGCGTGHQVAGVLHSFSGVRVTAVDLSLASLGFAKRMTGALGLPDIEYGQADILELGALGKQFDVIESSGVLHHMADPLAGWRVLAKLLRPRGVMRIGLYSTLARRDITAARAFAARQGWPATADGIRAARQAILALPDGTPEKRVALIGDFFSLSDCRDLLFHVQEHTFGLPGIAAFLAEQNLAFLGFDVPRAVARRYAERFPEDRAQLNLDHWHAFEQDNPDTFIAMYDFWLQKRDTAPVTPT